MIDFSDFIRLAPRFAAELFDAGLEHDSAPMSFFPYPKLGGTGLRWMGICDIRDLVLLRSAVGPVAEIADRTLPHNVHSSRLIRKPPAWRLRQGTKAHERFRRAVTERLLSDVFGDRFLPMCAADVRSYYPSIELEFLERDLLALRCPSMSVEAICGFLRQWAERDHLRGLPVGPEFSAVLGNTFLGAVDQGLNAGGVPFERYMDDIVMFSVNGMSEEDILRVLDHALMELRLLRSIPKTTIYEDWFEAYDAIEDSLLVSLGSIRSRRAAETPDRVRRAFDEDVWDADPPRPKRFTWVIRYLMNRRDPYAVRRLAEHIRLMNVEPATAASYLATSGLSDPQGVNGMMSALEAPPGDDRDALDLHLLRAVSRRSWGRAEGNLFMRIAQDSQRRAAVRSWALVAAQATPAWQISEAVDFLQQESDPMVRRSAVVALARNPSVSERRKVLEHIAARSPELRYTTAWGLAAA